MIILYTVFYITSYFLAKSGQYILSGLLLIIAAFGLYFADYKRTGSIINLRGVFSLSFVGGEGLSCFKLSYLQTDWDIKTWIAFFLAFMSFYFAFEILLKKIKKEPTETTRVINQDRLFVAIMVLAAVTSVCFIAEAVILQYIPLFLRGVPHAYSEFHVMGVHYITTSCVLVPALCVIWLLRCRDKDTDKTKTVWIMIAALTGIIIPLLCVSRFQMVFAVVLALFTYIALEGKAAGKWVAIAFAVAVPVYLLLSVARSHNAEYLMSVFEMRDDVPLLLAHPYMYIANNYDNFNTLVIQLPKHTYGLRIMYPFLTLSGIKFIRPLLVAWPVYITKPELTTLTVFYDFYYDFGLVGMVLGGAVLGTVSYLAERLVIGRHDSMASVIYAQLAIYMGLSFFTTWFSNPSTWVYFAISVLLYLIVTEDKQRICTDMRQ